MTDRTHNTPAFWQKLKDRVFTISLTLNIITAAGFYWGVVELPK